MPFSIFRLRTLVGANVAGLILGTAIFAVFLMLTLYMQQVLDYSAMKTGVGVPGRRRDRDPLVGASQRSSSPASASSRCWSPGWRA